MHQIRILKSRWSRINPCCGIRNSSAALRRQRAKWPTHRSRRMASGLTTGPTLWTSSRTISWSTQVVETILCCFTRSKRLWQLGRLRFEDSRQLSTTACYWMWPPSPLWLVSITIRPQKTRSTSCSTRSPCPSSRARVRSTLEMANTWYEKDSIFHDRICMLALYGALIYSSLLSIHIYFSAVSLYAKCT